MRLWSRPIKRIPNRKAKAELYDLDRRSDVWASAPLITSNFLNKDFHVCTSKYSNIKTGNFFHKIKKGINSNFFFGAIRIQSRVSSPKGFPPQLCKFLCAYSSIHTHLYVYISVCKCVYVFL